MTSTQETQIIARITGNGTQGQGTYSLIFDPNNGGFEVGFWVKGGNVQVLGVYPTEGEAIRALDQATHYNATAEGLRYGSLEAVKVDHLGRVWRACGFWCHLNGSPQYHEAWAKGMSYQDGFKIHRDNCQKYRESIANMGIGFKK